jgi:hypothetical protein
MPNRVDVQLLALLCESVEALKGRTHRGQIEIQSRRRQVLGEFIEVVNFVAMLVFGER